MKKTLILSAIAISFIASTLEGCNLSTVLLLNAISICLLLISGIKAKKKSPRKLELSRATTKNTQPYYTTVRSRMQ